MSLVSDHDTTPWWKNPTLTVPAAVCLLAAIIGLVGVLIRSGSPGPTRSAGPTSTTAQEPPSGQTTSPTPAAPAPSSSSAGTVLYANQQLTLRDPGCNGETYVTLDNPPSVSRSSSAHDAFNYDSCAKAEPTVQIDSGASVSPLNDVANTRDVCLTALRTDALDSTPISKVTALCFRTSDGTIAQVVVNKVDRDGTAHVSVTGWKDE
jgi:hypothetical protein